MKSQEFRFYWQRWNKLLLFALLLGISGAIVFRVGVSHYEIQSELDRDGKPVVAAISYKRAHNPKSFGGYIEYRFTINSKTYSGANTVADELYWPSRVGDHLDVIYLARDPTISRLRSAILMTDDASWLLGGSILLIAAGLCVGITIWATKNGFL